MSPCVAGSSARARVHRAARSLRLRSPTAAVDTLGPNEGQWDCWTLEATLVEADAAGPAVYGALGDERLELDAVMTVPMNSWAAIALTERISHNAHQLADQYPVYGR